MVFRFYILISCLVFTAFCQFGGWEGTATHWCDSINFPNYKVSCGGPVDGYMGALANIQFNEIKCPCDAGSTNVPITINGITKSYPRCNSYPQCGKEDLKKGWCGTKLCVECVDSKCNSPGSKITISLTDACPYDHFKNVDDCKANPSFSTCRCLIGGEKNIDLGCTAFAALANLDYSPLKVKVTEGACPPGSVGPKQGEVSPMVCDDLPPPNSPGQPQYTCQQQAAWNNCEASFIKNHPRFCRISCGKCVEEDGPQPIGVQGKEAHQLTDFVNKYGPVPITNPDDEMNVDNTDTTSIQPPKSPSSDSSDCTDIPPDNLHTCQEQVKWDKCKYDWMANFCHKSCGRCGGDSATPPPPPPSSECSDIPPPRSLFTCKQQAGWSKCNQNFMKGYCNKSCRRCTNAAETDVEQLSDTMDTLSSSSPTSISEISYNIIFIGASVGIVIIVILFFIYNKKLKAKEIPENP